MHLTSPVPHTGFEGPEKKLEVHFKKTHKFSLRSLNQEQWQKVLDSAKCTIISSSKNEYFDSYILSESSLFVYPLKVILKTCGTTTLLYCLPKLIEVATEHDTEIDLVLFSRKNLNFPSKQCFPHSNFWDEVKYLNKMFTGQGYVLGPSDQDHWHLYIAHGRAGQTSIRPRQTFEIMMHDLDPQVMDQFYHKEGITAKDVTENTGISCLMPGSTIDEFQFEPCGYSMNGLLDEWYWTIHITPESHCSYVSFETNAPLLSYSRLLKKVVELFRPGRFTVAFLASGETLCGDLVSSDSVPEFEMMSQTMQTIPRSGLTVLACNYSLFTL